MSFWEYEALNYNTLHPRLELIRDKILSVNPHNIVFEMGCSVGALREDLRGRGIDYWGCDLSKSAVAQIGDPKVVTYDLNADELPFDGPFDVIAGSGVLEYIDDIPALLAAARKRLDTGGHLVVSYYNMTHVLRVLRSKSPRPLPRHAGWRHSFSPRKIVAMIEAAGFRMVDEESVSLQGLRQEHRSLRSLPGRRLHASQIVYVAEA